MPTHLKYTDPSIIPVLLREAKADLVLEVHDKTDFDLTCEKLGITEVYYVTIHIFVCYDVTPEIFGIFYADPNVRRITLKLEKEKS